MHTIPVVIAGNTYYLAAEDDKSHLQSVAAQVNDLLCELKEKFPEYSNSKLAILTALQLADELLKIREEYAQLQGEVELLTENRWK